MLRRSLFVAGAALAVLLLASQFTSTASAGPWEPDDGFFTFDTCLRDDYYAPDGTTLWFAAGTYTWRTTYAFYQGLVADPTHAWFWPTEVLGSCPLIADTEVDVTFGQELDLWHGSCGMYFEESPFTGLASLGPVGTPEGITALRGACGLTVTGADEQVIANPVAGLYYYYYELNQHLYNLWLAEGLGLFVYDAFDMVWNECSSFHIDLDLDNGDYGRVVCVANYLGPFTVGEK